MKKLIYVIPVAAVLFFVAAIIKISHYDMAVIVRHLIK